MVRLAIDAMLAAGQLLTASMSTNKPQSPDPYDPHAEVWLPPQDEPWLLVSVETEEGVVVYDADNPLAWVEADVPYPTERQSYL